MAVSNRAWRKPSVIDVCLPVAFWYASASSCDDWPVRPDLNGWVGDHQTSTERPSARGPSGAIAAGNSVALAIATTFGWKFCCAAALANAVNSGGGRTPAMISAPAVLKAAICAL